MTMVTACALIAALSCIQLPPAALAQLSSEEQLPQAKFNLTDQFEYVSFSGAFSPVWASDHHEVSEDTMKVKLKLDKKSGTGIRSKHRYMFGFFSSAVKLPANYSAGVVTTFYASNDAVFPHNHDEIDIEFLGVVPGEPYIIQTNVYGNGSTHIGREQRFRLWFDPTADFHQYSILWTPYHIVFFVDNIPIRQFLNVEVLGMQFPSKPMNLLATIWDASQWATDGGRAKANYSYAPFVAAYSHLILNGCHFMGSSSVECTSGSSTKTKSFLSVIPPTLSRSQHHLLHWVRRNYMIYDYCKDLPRYPNGLPECPRAGRMTKN